jgi:hypothetical protein
MKDGLCKARMILNILTGNVTMTGNHECSKVIENTITLKTSTVNYSEGGMMNYAITNS